MGMYEDLLRAAELDPERAVIRIITHYEPAGGSDARVFPPTYPTGPRDEHPYVIEPRRVGAEEKHGVLLDSVPSEANRVEEALLRAQREKRIQIPTMSIEHDAITISSLDAPHRYADAYLRDSTIDGVAFDRSEIGKTMLASSADDATGLFTYDPGSLVYGAWNSHRKGRQTRFPRIYASEIIGWDPSLGRRKAGRMDPLNLQGAAAGSGDDWTYIRVEEKAAARKDKTGVRLSEIGHGNIAPNDAHGGVTINGASRTATLSFAALDRLRFGAADHDAQVAARAALAAYALAGDRLAFGGGSLWLRSGCELIVTEESLTWVGRGGVQTSFELSTDSALELFDTARAHAEKLGLHMNLDPVRLEPSKPLAEAIDFAITKATSGD